MASKKDHKLLTTASNSISQQFTNTLEGFMIESDEEETTVNTSAQSLGLRAQKKLLGKISSKSVAKVFIDETSSRVLDNLHKLTRAYSDSKKESDKLLKSIIKTIVKLGILYKNDLFNEYELKYMDDFRNRFHSLAKAVVTFYEVDFTYDRVFLARMCKECQDLVHKIISTHLSQKSHIRIDYIFNTLSNLQFIDYVFNSNSTLNRAIVKDIVQDMNRLMDSGLL
ncbi:unnamed protein product [Rotaria socialis]|uniref:Tumor necrosis factor alpha-induced protein 8-like protein n=2 Tax=Rotaria socialis TaxID=392032 RepID=A0A817UCH6_9BILA|nr:unnamed protein product [Rotaria socialis]CAF3336875.1 unnamed protein product [Rotaria socialis]CAF3525621.1 unnamed protein product [Rotaria socialis]CAF3566980.1 unnamed protein product [Rotaria socialis]CAF4162188.1 unnamed protein product [Rotaria socialis]